jgi:hypothetical protein
MRFFRKRTDHEFCKEQCRNAAWKRPRKRRCKGTPLGSVANGPFSSSKTVTCKAPSTPDLGAFVRGEIVAQTRSTPSALLFLTARTAEPGLPAIRAVPRSVMICFGGSTSKNSFGGGNGDPKRLPGRQQPRRYAGQSLSSGAMTRFETHTTRFSH